MAYEETGFGTIKCPACDEAIPISEAIHHQIAERTRQELKAEALEGKRVLAARERELNAKAAILEQTISERLAAERINISKELEAKLRSGLQRKLQTLSVNQTSAVRGSHKHKQSSLNFEPRNET